MAFSAGLRKADIVTMVAAIAAAETRSAARCPVTGPIVAASSARNRRGSGPSASTRLGAHPSSGGAVGRTAQVKRETKESSVLVELDLDGQGNADIETGVP